MKMLGISLGRPPKTEEQCVDSIRVSLEHPKKSGVLYGRKTVFFYVMFVSWWWSGDWLV